MTPFRSLISTTGGRRRSTGWWVTALLLGILTPVIVVGLAFATVAPADQTAGAVAVRLPAAIVNLDTPIEATLGGTSTPVAAGKLLTQQLMSDSESGFSWKLTDESAAATGLAAGTFSAVVTIPSDFSAAYSSSTGPAPVHATLGVTTNAETGLATQMLAGTLAATLQNNLAATLTQGFVTQLLVGFTELHTQLGTAADGADQLAGGAAALADGSKAAADGTTALASGAQQLSSGLGQIASATAELPQSTAELAALADLAAVGASAVTDGVLDSSHTTTVVRSDVTALSTSVTTLRDELPSLSQAQIVDRLNQLDSAISGVGARVNEVSGKLLLTAIASGLEKDGTALLSSGTKALAAGIPTLSTGLNAAAAGAAELANGTTQLSEGSSQLASGADQLSGGVRQLADGLVTAAAAVPSYTAAEQKTLASVVATPIVTRVNDNAVAPTAQGAITAIVLPLALWVGAFVIYLLLTPFSVGAIASSASLWRVTVRALTPAVGLAAAQALVVALWLSVAAPDLSSRAWIIGLSVLMSISFVMLHQGLVALLGRLGWLLSIALLALQVSASGLLVSTVLQPDWIRDLAAFLPVAAVSRSLQTLGSGGGANVGGAVGILVISGLLGVALTILAASRLRTPRAALVE